jgi:hypothetical protein
VIPLYLSLCSTKKLFHVWLQHVHYKSKLILT